MPRVPSTLVRAFTNFESIKNLSDVVSLKVSLMHRCYVSASDETLPLLCKILGSCQAMLSDPCVSAS